MNGMTPAQRADLATLLLSNVLPSMIRWLGERVLGRKAIIDIESELANTNAKAKLLVDAMHNAGRLPEAIAILKTETRNSDLLRGLNHILSGSPLSMLPGLEATVQARDDPFLNNDFIELHYPRVQRTVCAIGLGPPKNRLVGTGFLIAPDLVLTNFHVVCQYLIVGSKDGRDFISENARGDNLYFFFDYLSPPRPLVPPDQAKPHASVVVNAARQNWLVRASRALDNEGVAPFPNDVNRRFDYAVIRLEKSIGNLPCRKSGGALRGWLLLENGLSLFDDIGSRLVVLQHPSGAEQLWDIGEYDGMDPSQTRIRYRINTESGASGGPAVDRRGRVYAIHNAVVRESDADPTHNQGVRIDAILNDFRQGTGIALPAVMEEDIGYWSLSDSLTDPRPIIGRTAFRQSVLKMTGAASSERILIVTGPKDSGRRFSIDLLKRIVGAKVPVIRFTPDDLAILRPRAFIRAFANELALKSVSTMPEPKTTESDARWISGDLPKWLGEKLTADQDQHPSRYPIWIVLEAVAPEGRRLAWAEDLTDLLSTLMGNSDAGSGVPELTQIRWLLLGASHTAFPPTRAAPIIDDLSVDINTNYADDFADCVSLGWRSIDKAASMDRGLLKNWGKVLVKDATDDNKPIPAYLARYVGRVIKGQ